MEIRSLKTPLDVNTTMDPFVHSLFVVLGRPNAVIVFLWPTRLGALGAARTSTKKKQKTQKKRDALDEQDKRNRKTATETTKDVHK